MRNTRSSRPSLSPLLTLPQAAIRRVFEIATSKISIPGTEVVAFPLFRVLDGSDTRDYLQRVEPSPQGGAKMARALMDAVLGVNTEFWANSLSDSELLDGDASSPPAFQQMPRS